MSMPAAPHLLTLACQCCMLDDACCLAAAGAVRRVPGSDQAAQDAEEGCATGLPNGSAGALIGCSLQPSGLVFEPCLAASAVMADAQASNSMSCRWHCRWMQTVSRHRLGAGARVWWRRRQPRLLAPPGSLSTAPAPTAQLPGSSAPAWRWLPGRGAWATVAAAGQPAVGRMCRMATGSILVTRSMAPVSRYLHHALQPVRLRSSGQCR